MALKIRRGLETDRSSVTPEEGEFLYVTDTGLLYIGDGTTAGGNLVAGGGGGGGVETYTDFASFPMTGTTGILYIAEDTGFAYYWDGATYQQAGGGGSFVESVTGDGVDNTDPFNPVLTYPTPGDIGAQVALGFTPENVANKSDSYTVSSSTTYASTKAVVDGLATKQASLGYTAANDADVVKLTGNQTVDGVKTFSSFPVTPSSLPTTDYQAANKAYVDSVADLDMLEMAYTSSMYLLTR
jgi:hypothetical protein